MKRLVRQVKPAPTKPEDAIPRPFSGFTSQSSIVLLGDPGAGKTHLFREAAAAENARLIRTRDFLNTPAANLRGQALYIDGIDERRAGRGDRDTIDRLVVQLFEVAPLKVRISCRAADWLGDSDLAAFAPFFDQQGGCHVLHLENLSHAEQIAVLVGQGTGTDEAERFIEEAMQRGLQEFLENPQNLIMLWRAVQSGSWPGTRKELFELATQLMLQEPNKEHARSGSGSFSGQELRAVSGAICAVRLISDVDAISLTDQDGDRDIPGYRSMVLFSPDKVQAALGRRVFDAAPEPEAVDYAHRTTAEFLAAEYLASLVRDGLPFGRLMALIGVDGHPSSELRGLHAWLAVHLPEHAEQLIEADPYGVLTYGDAASLSTASSASLVRALDRLSQKNPWFRSGNWQARPIGALARPDLISEFRAILESPTSGFGVRSIVVDALALGTPLPDMLPDMGAVLTRSASPFSERLRAFEALLRLGEAGKAAIRSTFTQLGSSKNDMRLRAVIVQSLYGAPYGPDDVIELVKSSFAIEGSDSATVFWALADSLPEADLPSILDGVDTPASGTNYDKYWPASSFYARILVRAWASGAQIEPSRLMKWLYKRFFFRGESRARDLRAAMQDQPERLREVAEDWFKHIQIDEKKWTALYRFREAILFQLDAEALASIAINVFDAETADDRRLFLYEVALSLSYQIDAGRGPKLFEELYQRADNDPKLRAARDAITLTNLPANFYSGRSRIVKNKNGQSRQQADFDADIDQIVAGEHIGWLEHLSRIYFGLYQDSDRTLSPHDRISVWLGEERLAAALQALSAALSRSDLPGFDQVMALTENHKHYDWWYALVAGLNERWPVTGLSDLSDDFLKAMLVFDIANPVFSEVDGSERIIVHPWRTALIERRPDLVRDAYLTLAKLRLSSREAIVDGLDELLNEAGLEAYRADIVIDLLKQFPNANQFRLSNLLEAAALLPSTHEAVLKLAEDIVVGTTTVDEQQRDLWLAAAYMLSPARFEKYIRERATVRPGIVFDLRDKSGFVRRQQPDHPLPLPMLEFLAQITGTTFPSTPHPQTSWSGDTNPWDASEYFRTLVNIMSTLPSSAATEALERLKADPRLSSYRPQILFALATQLQRRRDNDYDRPNWAQTVSTLANRAPATVADLHALLIDQLCDFAHRVARTNTDIFKQFWNVDQYARPVDPRPEEACRDVVVTLLRPTLLPVGVLVEPEGHMAADKRADISAAMPGRKILCELKRDYHADVWTAISDQLERFYAHDPEAKGFGIYVVFWFGSKRPQPIPVPPNGMSRPQSAGEMEAMLRSFLPEDKRSRIAIVVMDVSGDV